MALILWILTMIACTCYNLLSDESKEYSKRARIILGLCCYGCGAVAAIIGIFWFDEQSQEVKISVGLYITIICCSFLTLKELQKIHRKLDAIMQRQMRYSSFDDGV